MENVTTKVDVILELLGLENNRGTYLGWTIGWTLSKGTQAR
jgi:hypothetical protein